MDHHRKAWRFKRFAWVIMLLIGIATLAGAFGGGPLSRASISQDGVTINYERFMRFSAPAEWEFRFNGLTNSQVKIRINTEALEVFSVKEISPSPAQELTALDHHIFIFQVAPNQTSARVTFHIEPQLIGNAVVTINFGENESLQFNHWIYP